MNSVETPVKEQMNLERRSESAAGCVPRPALQRLRRGLGRGSLILAPITVAILAGCQSSAPVQTRIPALPPGQENASYYVSAAINMMPSAQVDAGRIATDPITGKSAAVGGMQTYLQNCTSCHGQTGKPAAAGVPDLSDPVFTWSRTPQDLFKDLLTSPAHVQQAQLAQKLDRQALWNAVFYVWTLHSTSNDVVQGGLTFGKYCSVCHGTKGRGDGNLADGLNPPPRRFVDFAWMVDKTDQRLYISISDGRPPSAMPAWKPALSPTQRIQIIQYLRQFTYNYPKDIQKAMAEAPPAS